MTSPRLLLPLTLCLVSIAHAEEKPKLLVLDLNAPATVDASIAKTLGDAVTAEVSRRGYFQVLSSQDVQTLLGIERQKQLLGCSETSNTCMTELAGALGAQLTLSGSLGKLGDTWQLTLQMLDTTRGQQVGRTSRLAHSPETLLLLLPSAVAEATGTPQPPAKSRVIPYTLIGAGAAAVIGGGVLGYQALSSDTSLTKELELGAQGNAVLGTGASYEARAGQIAQERTISLVLMGAGVALLGTGILLLPRTGDDVQIAVVPTFSGAALAGVFP